MKRRKIKSKAIRESAFMEECTVNSSICSYNRSQTVLAHIPDESNGMGTKSNDTSAVYACALCHDVIDRRQHCSEFEENREFYLLRALQRTMVRLVEKGIVKIIDFTVYDDRDLF